MILSTEKSVKIQAILVDRTVLADVLEGNTRVYANLVRTSLCVHQEGVRDV
jgi:hypothetical protein